MATNQYWRAKFPYGNYGAGEFLGRQWMTVREANFSLTVGGATATTGGTAFAGNSLGGFPPANAFDGSTGTFWSSNNTTANTVNNYLGYDFGTTKNIVYVVLTPEPTVPGDLPGWAPIESSPDGITYTPQFGIAPLSGYGENRAAGLVGGKRWWGVRVNTTPGGTAQVIIGQIYLSNATVPHPGFAFSARALATDDEDAAWEGAGNVLNCGSECRWVTSAASAPHYVVFDFGNDRPLPTELRLVSPATVAYNKMPDTFDVVWSDDGVTLHTFQSFTAAAWTANSQSQTFAITANFGGVLRSRVTMA